MALKLRELTAEEQGVIKQLARSRTAAARLVERARIILQAAQGHAVPAIAEHLKLNQATVRTWLKRFNSEGIVGLHDLHRSGRPTTFTPEEVAQVVAASLTDPQTLSLPFGSWTMDRLAAYLQEQQQLTISRSRISELLIAEGLRWRTQETWFGERVDPEFAEKRGASRAYTRPRLRVAGS